MAELLATAALSRLGLSCNQACDGIQTTEEHFQQPCDPRRIWQQLQPELAVHVARFLTPNDIACTLRFVNKAAAVQFRGPLYTVIHLSQPVPPHAFSSVWGCPGALRRLTFKRRVELVRLTAASGSIPNLQIAMDVAGCLPTPVLIAAAAKAGHLEACRWLHDQGCPWDATVTRAAAAAGQLHVLSWLLQAGCPCDQYAMHAAAEAGQQAACELLLSARCHWSFSAVEAAARGGHMRLLEWLQQRELELGGPDDPQDRALQIVTCAAAGCDLATLQRLHAQLLEGPGVPGVPQEEQQPGQDAAPELPLPVYELHGQVLAAAASSPTPDWAAKVEWLERRGYTPHIDATNAVLSTPDALDRLTWLRPRGYPADHWTLFLAASSGQVEVCEHFLPEEDGDHTIIGGGYAASRAAVNGHLSVLQLLCRRGVRLDTQLLSDAASCGHLAVVSWAWEQVALNPSVVNPNIWSGPAALLLYMLRGAAAAGDVELMTWLVERRLQNAERITWMVEKRLPDEEGGGEGPGGGARLRPSAGVGIWGAAAASGCEAALEWLAERGWPMDNDGEPYCAAARQGDMATLRYLRRRCCDWGLGGKVACQVVKKTWGMLPSSCILTVLGWLQQAGYPAFWGHALADACRAEASPEVIAWLRERAAEA